MSSEMLFIFRSIPILILFSGCVLLLIKKKTHIIFWSILGLLVLESMSCFMAVNKLNYKHWTLYFSGLLYFILIHNLYSQLFFRLFEKTIYKVLLTIIAILMIVGLSYIHAKDSNFVFHYIAGVELIVLLYPINYFLKLANQSIKYDLKYFILNSIILLFFSLDIIIYVMIKFLKDYDLLRSIGINYFRYYTIQLFYISLIYFGCKLHKK